MRFKGDTEVLELSPARHLLRARSRPLGQALVELRLGAEGDPARSGPAPGAPA